MSWRCALSLLFALLVLVPAGTAKKDKTADAAAIKVTEMKVHRSGSENVITIDGRIVNSGAHPIPNLVLIFEVLGAEGDIVNRQRGKIDEDSLDAGQESELHWQMKDHPRAVDVRVRAVTDDERPVKVEAPGPYEIE